MKKLLALLMVLAMMFTLVACTTTPDNNGDDENKDNTGDEGNKDDGNKDDGNKDDGNKDDGNTDTFPATPMTYAEYIAAELDAPVYVETYVQGHQSWWSDKITVYCQDQNGGIFLYELACSEADAAKLVPGTKIAVKGYKAAFNGEVEIVDGTFEFVEGGDTYVAEAMDATALLGTDDMINHQNKFVSFKGLTVNNIEYKNGEPGDDIYLTLDKDGASYNFCVEIYLTGADSDVYTTVATLKAGDVVDVEAFLYWYEGMNPHVTAIAKVAA
ncbi:MAG: hypothetical protein IJY04_02780 [Clostridia bacterium]|nr:hypothetical protein [Clostridia bacterium]